jgi:FixJ family two-component response regulator
VPPISVSLPVVHLVDDDPQLLRAMSRLLRSYDFQVETYDSPVDFLTRVPASGPGCLVLDLSMPGMNGLELQQTVLDRRSDLAVIFVTGAGDIPASVQAMKAGAVDFLTKPFEDHALIGAVREGLRRARENQASRDLIEKDLIAYRRLSPREQQVCLLVSEGLLNKQIAGELGPTEKTIKLHRGNVMRKLNVNSVAELVKLVQRLRDSGRIASPAN